MLFLCDETLLEIIHFFLILSVCLISTGRLLKSCFVPGFRYEVFLPLSVEGHFESVHELPGLNGARVSHVQADHFRWAENNGTVLLHMGHPVSLPVSHPRVVYKKGHPHQVWGDFMELTCRTHSSLICRTADTTEEIKLNCFEY